MVGMEVLRAELMRLIQRGVDVVGDDRDFEQAALAVFEYQFNENEPYRRYCERRGVTPGSLDSWEGIPAVPTAAFKEAALVCGGVQGNETVFRTSGTSLGSERRGTHYVRDLELYEVSALTNFRGHLLPDTATLRMLLLGPERDRAPDSSLAWMLERIRGQFGAAGSEVFVDEEGLRVDPLIGVLRECEAGDRPVAMLGTAAAFAHLIEELEGRGVRFRLPLGSRAMETGGFKRRRREIPRAEFYAMLTARFGLSEYYCVAEYGMTEMCSQFYDNVLRERALARSPRVRYKVVPPWVRTLVVDAETLAPLPHGRLGVLRHFDLANLDSVMAIQTDDLGVSGPEGFEILGRAAGSELRGCSIAMDQWLTAQR